MADSDQPKPDLSELVFTEINRDRRRRRVVAGTLAVVVVVIALFATGTIAPERAAEIVLRRDFQLEERTAPINPDEPGQALLAVARADVDTITALSEPDPSSEEVAEFLNDPTYPLHFLSVLNFDAFVTSDMGDWIEVLLPVRPNGSRGWIQLSQVELRENPYRIEIDISDHQLTVFKDNELFDEATVAIGTGETPTPVGRFYTTDLFKVPIENSVYGPYAYGLSGFSDALTTFEGGDAIIGLHGTNDPRSLGTDVSHGCVRMPNELITKLAEILPLGTPVLIVEDRN
ncbi:MAG: L,D-transpeptidase [Acidimicrobiales bacterium]